MLAGSTTSGPLAFPNAAGATDLCCLLGLLVVEGESKQSSKEWLLSTGFTSGDVTRSDVAKKIEKMKKLR